MSKTLKGLKCKNMDEGKEIFDFADLVEYLATKKINKLSSNGGLEHAKIVVAQIFESSEIHINLFESEFDSNLFESNGVLFGLEHFLSRNNTSLSIKHVGSDSLSSCVLFNDILSNYKEKVKIKETKVSPRLSGKPISFLTADDCIFRLEKDTNEHTALFNFNDSSYTKILNNCFSDLPC